VAFSAARWARSELSVLRFDYAGWPLKEKATFLTEAPVSEAKDAAFDEDRDADGYVNNWTRLWCWRPDLLSAFRELRASLMGSSALADRDWAVLVTATAAERNDSYCSLAWGTRLATLTDETTAAQVIAGAPAPALSEREAALADWARQVVRDPNATTERDIARLREVGLGDQEIFEATAFVAFRLAFSAINDALGAAPTRSSPTRRRQRYEPRSTTGGRPHRRRRLGERFPAAFSSSCSRAVVSQLTHMGGGAAAINPYRAVGIRRSGQTVRWTCAITVDSRPPAAHTRCAMRAQSQSAGRSGVGSTPSTSI
jgi:uncharacterized peroxidase-related enzyme